MISEKETRLLNSVLQPVLDQCKNNIDAIEYIRQRLHEISPQNNSPVDRIRWVPFNQVQANDYNPNSVATKEMKLLHTSITHDGYTQPVVTIWDPSIKKYVIIDGFHRYLTLKTNPDIQEMTNGLLPIVVLEKDINDRMASTVRHNRARGKHSVGGMSNMVFNLLDNGWSDEDILAELGMEAEELIRLKHITGFSKLFENTEYNRAWKHKNQILNEKKYRESQNQETQQE